jgi:uncharacterized membrane protein
MRFLDDLLAILTATVVLLAVIALLPTSPARVALGLPFVLLFPGYTLIAALYPRRGDLDGVERLALSLGLSLAVVPLIGLVLNYTPWGIHLAPIAVGLTLFVTACSLAAARARARLAAPERFEADIRPVMRALRRFPWPAILISAAVVILLLLAGYRTGLLGVSKVGEPFTEFYVLGPGGKAQGYPRRLFVGEKAEVILGIANREGREAEYSIQVASATEVLRTLGPIVLRPGETHQGRVDFSLARPGKRVKVEFLLYMQDADTAPYRRLHLWVEVRAF